MAVWKFGWIVMGVPLLFFKKICLQQLGSFGQK
jgi:hypothetical protein